MNSIFENAGKLAAAITVAVVALSVVYEWGYFHVIGGEFQRFASPSDYLSNAIGWLPLLVLGLLFIGVQVSVFAMADSVIARWRNKPTQTDAFNYALYMAAGLFGVFGFLNLRDATDWPRFLAFLFISLWSFSV